MKTLEEREDVAYKNLEDGTIDKETYRKLIDQLRAKRDHYNHELEKLNLTISDASHAAVKEVFELAINAKSEWKKMERKDRVAFLKKVCSNPVLDDLSVRYHLKAPFARLAGWKENSEWRRE